MEIWYRKLFENFSRTYDQEPFVQGSVGECDFFEREIDFNRDIKILDIGCGTGRHSIELASREYRVTGIDLSGSMLRRAGEKAAERKAKVDFQNLDARDLLFKEDFGLVIMICEGAFPLMETDEMNLRILNSAFRALKTGGKLILTTLNGLCPLLHSVKDFMESVSKGDGSNSDKNTFDLMTFRDLHVTTVTDDSGNSIDLECNERYYLPSEITWQLKSLGFGTLAIYGAKLGSFSRNERLTTDDFEMLIIAKK